MATASTPTVSDVRPWPERVSKLATLAAVVLAIPLHLLVDPAAGSSLRVIAAVSFAAGVIGGARWPTIAPAVATAAAAVLPVALAAIARVAAMNVFYTIALAGLFGTLIRRIPRDGWHLPSSWRLPLGVWALTIALAWPVMIVREAGWRLGALRDTGTLDSWAFLTTPHVESWILHVVIAQLVGLLWLEWLCRDDHFPAANGLWIGASIASIVAVYQGTVDMTFLSADPWPGLRRAAGTLLDANAYGTLAAIAGPFAFVSIPSLSIRRARAMQGVVLAINWAGAWMSGSRTALLCGVFGTVLLIFEVVRSRRRVDADSKNGSPANASPAVAVAVAAVLLAIVGAGAIGPVQRLREAQVNRSSLHDLWSRGGYGTVATRMVRDYPLTGVGVGSYNWMAPDYWRVMANDRLPFDNAQNWWRHQVAELGIVASLPILFWSALVVWLVLTRRSPPDRRIETQTVRGLLIGIGIASLLGMPTQNPVVLLMFFALVARFERVTAPAARRLPAGGSRQLVERLGWIVGFVIAVGYAGGHLVLARGALNPIERAARTNRDYVTGTYETERGPEGQFRWTRQRATFSLGVTRPYLVIRYHLEHPDLDSRPVQLRITTSCQVIVDAVRSDSRVGERTLELPEGENRVTFDTEVSRTWRPSDTGQPDSRDLGAAIETDFVGQSDGSQGGVLQLKQCD